MPSGFLNKFKLSFGFDWLTVQWKDLLKPYYSGLASYLYLESLTYSHALKIPLDLKLQSGIWDKHFDNKRENGKFFNKSIALDKSK